MENEKKIIEFLRRSIIFKNLSDEELRKITVYFQIIELEEGTPIFYENEKSSDMYIILEGKVKACVFNDEGNELVLAELEAGDILGEMSVIDELPRSATVITQERTKLAKLSRQSFLKIIRENPDIAINVMKALVSRLRRCDDLIEALAFRSVEKRIVDYLLEIGKKRGRTEEGKYKVRKLTHRDLASRIGASREAVTKALKSLTFKGIIESRGNFWLVPPDAGQRLERN